MTTDQSLLLEWDLLQEEVIPTLVDGGTNGPPRSWSLGSVEDAASLAVAFDAAPGAPSTDSDSRDSYVADSYVLESYATSSRSEVGFRRLDLRQVPDASRRSFVRDDQRWFVDESIAGRIFLHAPPGAVESVDVVTIRDNASERAIDTAVALIRTGGRLVALGALAGRHDPGRLTYLDRFAYVASGRAGSVYEKRASEFSGAAPPSRNGDAADELELEAGETLAHARAARKLVGDHARLAASLARRFAHRGESEDDLEQVAMLALVKAAGRFDPSRDTLFATYATTSILGELKRHFRDKSWAMKVPRHLQETYLSVKKAREELTHLLGAQPTVEQIADRIGLAGDEVLKALGAGDNFWPRSLDAVYGDEERIEIRVEDGGFEQALGRVQAQSRMPVLEEQERLVLRRIHFDEWTQQQVATELGVSQMQVCRLQARALTKLRT